ncbi:Glucosidase 2 subunit beta protein [Dioscorea alata]|uniref:Glucosidase 2 subunit beta protein n=1 Tax=Dioscorea alata TaxID=55571 RepID=A0ACB7VT03_DIOAL|nr:Glucosidase 2 subunit beta protein [Dioscorea alata]
MGFMGADLRVSLAIALFSLLWVSGFSVVPSKDSLGIAPQDEGYYKSSVIQCKDGSKKFTKEQLNDEFCDCLDGTDEPGTSACPEGKFYCRNAGHIPLTIFSSRVNDGICDCCDGSDEYHSHMKCPNTCWEAGRAARENLKKRIATYQEGVRMRKGDVDRARQAFAKDEADLAKLKAEEESLSALVQKLKENKERIEKAEEEGRKRKEEEEKRMREESEKVNAQEIAPEETLHSNAEALHAEISASADKPVDAQDDPSLKAEAGAESGAKEVSTEHVTDQVQENVDMEKLSKEELGRLVASRWTGENAAPKMDGDTTTKEKHSDDNNLDTSNSGNVRGDDDDSYTSGTDADSKYDDEDDDDDDDDDEDDISDDEFEDVDTSRSFNPDNDEKAEVSDLTSSSTSSWLEKLQQTVQNVLQAFDFFKTPVELSEGARVRKEYDDLSSKLSKLRSRIARLTDMLKHDFGKEKEFYSFYDHCFESKRNKYTYKVCPFKEAIQVEGHSTTRLGNWDKFEDSYRIMQFSSGARCWNGPDRSLKVRLRCGLKNELTDIDEPSRCEYKAMLSTPAVCTEEKLQELQQKLEQMNSNQLSPHDEL